MADYFVVGSQADADKLKTCQTIKGDLFINTRYATGPLIIDGPQHVKEGLTLNLYSGHENPLFTSLSMRTLTRVSGIMHLSNGQSSNSPKAKRGNLGVLDFPALEYAGYDFSAKELDSVHTFNFPSLEYAVSMDFNRNPKLHTIHAPNLTKLNVLTFQQLPSLRNTPSFLVDARFNSPIRKITIEETSLTNLSIPNLEVLSALRVTDNKNLRTISLPDTTLVTEFRPERGGYIIVRDNNPDLHLSLPKLQKVTGLMSISALREIEIPELRSIGMDAIEGRPHSLIVGAEQDWFPVPCSSCHPTHLTTFSAPKLRHVEGRIQFDTCPKLKNISLPGLQSAKELVTNNTAAMKLKGGLSMPNFKQVEHVQILGTDSRCAYFDNLYCGGGVEGNYSCGMVEIWQPARQYRLFRKFPSFPPDCTRDDGISLPDEEEDTADWLDWIGGIMFEECYSFYCMSSRMVRTRFLATLVFSMVAAAILWRFLNRWLKRKRRERENGGRYKQAQE